MPLMPLLTLMRCSASMPLMHLSVRNVPDDLIKVLKSLAIESGVSLREIVIQLLKENSNGPREANRVERTPRVSRVRRRVQDGQGAERTGSDGSTAVLGSSDSSPANSGAMGECLQQDTSLEGAQVYLGPKHAKDCQCKTCTHNTKTCQVYECGMCKVS